MNRLVEIGKGAGEILLRYKEKFKNIEVKSISSDVVSEADFASQDFIINELSRSFPGVKVICEENYSEENFLDGDVFLVDPLDGSLNYVHGYTFYSVSIARLENGRVVEGVVYLPEYNEIFYAELSAGAFFNGEKLERKSDVDFNRSLIVTGWPYTKEGIRWTYRAIETVNERIHEIRILGSCAAELSYLAAGRIDGYFEIGLAPWDISAGALIAMEAGCMVTDLSGSGLDLKKGEVVAGVPSVHGELLKILREVVA